MNTNRKGTKGLIKVMDDLQDKGYYCFFPIDDHSPVDLIALDTNGRVFRLQIKYKGSDKVLSTHSVVNGKKVPIDRTLIDGWAIYLSEYNKVVYLSTEFMKDKKYHTVNINNNYGELAEWFMAPLC